MKKSLNAGYKPIRLKHNETFKYLISLANE